MRRTITASRPMGPMDPHTALVLAAGTTTSTIPAPGSTSSTAEVGGPGGTTASGGTGSSVCSRDDRSTEGPDGDDRRHGTGDPPDARTPRRHVLGDPIVPATSGVLGARGPRHCLGRDGDRARPARREVRDRGLAYGEADRHDSKGAHPGSSAHGDRRSFHPIIHLAQMERMNDGADASAPSSPDAPPA